MRMRNIATQIGRNPKPELRTKFAKNFLECIRSVSKFSRGLEYCSAMHEVLTKYCDENPYQNWLDPVYRHCTEWPDFNLGNAKERRQIAGTVAHNPQPIDNGRT